jgi:hypothetical protein
VTPARAHRLRTVLMDSHSRSAQIGRLEVVEPGRRRRWSEDEMVKMSRSCLGVCSRLPGLGHTTAIRDFTIAAAAMSAIVWVEQKGSSWVWVRRHEAPSPIPSLLDARTAEQWFPGILVICAPYVLSDASTRLVRGRNDTPFLKEKVVDIGQLQQRRLQKAPT